jgi:hypothetical protein
MVNPLAGMESSAPAIINGTRAGFGIESERRRVSDKVGVDRRKLIPTLKPQLDERKKQTAESVWPVFRLKESGECGWIVPETSNGEMALR